MFSSHTHWISTLAICGGLVVVPANAHGLAPAEPVKFLAVLGGKRSMQIATLNVTSVNDAALLQRDGSPVKLADCIALLNSEPPSPRPTPKGMVYLADGQRIPGEPADAQPSKDGLAWNHPWLGRMEIPLKMIESLVLQPNATAPAPAAADLVVLNNGDRYDGFITALGNPLSIEIDRGGGKHEVINVPLDRVATVSMVTPRQKANGRRIWFGEGTVLDVQSITVGDDGVIHLSGSALISGTQVTGLTLKDVAAIQIDPQAMIPLATIAASRIEGPATRYVIPPPQALDRAAPLELSRLEFRGPMVARYAVPMGSQRLLAEAALPGEARAWGDCELVIRSDDAEVFRARLNRSSPTASINVPLTGRELTIEITQGAHGPIQDVVVLSRAMLLRRG